MKSNKKIDSMYTEVFTMHVDTVNELEFPNIETPKTIMKGKGGG